MDAHGGRVDSEAGGSRRRLTEAAKAALAALVDAARRLGPASRQRLGDHILEEADRGNEQEEAGGDRRNAPRGDSP